MAAGESDLSVPSLEETGRFVPVGSRTGQDGPLDPTAPFASHVAEELWRRLGHRESVSRGAVEKWLEGKTIVKAIVVPGRLVNFVVR
jgi:hypothetical protein